MTYLTGGGELCFCNPSSGNVHESTASGSFDPLTSRCSISVGTTGDTVSYAEWVFTSTTTTPNVGFMGFNGVPGFGGEYDWLVLTDSSGNARVKVTAMRKDGTGGGDTFLRTYYLSGTSWVQTGSGGWTNMQTLQKFDLSVNAAASGYLRLYASKSLLVDSGTLDLSALGSFGRFRFYSLWSANYISETIISSASTVRLRGYIRYPAGEGPDTAGIGAYTDVDEIVYSDVDGISFDAANEVHTVAGSTTTLGGFAVEAVIVGARAALGTSGPTKLDLAIRSPSDNTNHFSSDVSLAAGYGAAIGVWATDPGTSAAWTATNASTSKFGMKSIA